jgi:hypothetical protein
MTCSAASGTCPTCRSGCERKPGWFLPGEAEAAADLLGVGLAELFTTRLNVDYWWEDERLSPTTFVLTPRVGDNEPGTVLGLESRGRCTFYVEGRCEIHAAKPFECAQWWCGADELVPHVDVARAWTEHQGQIAELLGEEPQVPDLTIGSVLDFLGGVLDRIAEEES